MNDSPIFRLDLVGVKDAMVKAEFNLPALVFTRDIQIMQLQTEVYSSFDQHHILVTWKEKKPLRSRALIIWSLFRPWQPPIVENIPDSACGEYEFSISRSDHAEGMYRMQMVRGRSLGTLYHHHLYRPLRIQRSVTNSKYHHLAND